jgi:hypothetical protein
VVSNLGNSKCPKCGEFLDGMSVARYHSPFASPFRRMELRFPEYYKWVTIGLSVGVSLLLSIRLGYMGRAF